jgi:transposase
MLSIEKRTTGEIANLLKAERTTVFGWIRNWNEHGAEGLLEGHRSGRPRRLSEQEREQLTDIVDSGPVAYGFESGVWTSPMIAQVIADEFGVGYHPGHVRKLLHDLRFSVQRPTTKLVRADPVLQRKWVRYSYPNIKKKPARKER